MTRDFEAEWAVARATLARDRFDGAGSVRALIARVESDPNGIERWEATSIRALRKRLDA